MNPQETFVTRLRRHRTRNRVSIEEIAANLRIRPELLEGLERNDLTGWPRGLHSRAWIRAVRGGRRPRSRTIPSTSSAGCFHRATAAPGGTIQGIASIVASSSEYRDEFSHVQGRRSTDQHVPDEPRPAVACTS